MTVTEIINHRLANQRITGTTFQKPQEVVSWLGAMQAQEYAMSKWSIGLRVARLNDAEVEKAFNEGSILRTHVLRPTWHFVAPADIRWMLKLTAPRVHTANAFLYRSLELNSKILKRSNDTLAQTLQGGNYLTRAALKDALERAKNTGRWIAPRLPDDVRRTGRCYLQRPPARQTVHLRAAG